LVGVYIIGLIGEQGYDCCFLCKLGHDDFGEDVILAEDSGKIEKVEMGEIGACGPLAM